MNANATLLEKLYAAECPGLTARRVTRAGGGAGPIVWSRAEGDRVWDADDNAYWDFSGGFGVALLGHRPNAVATVVRQQVDRLWHALGDLHPSDRKIELLEKLVAIAPFRARAMLGLSGADAVEAAIKSATLYTRRPAIIAFEGGYHGLSYGPLAACGYALKFRQPFASQLNPHARILPFPEDEHLPENRVFELLEADLARGDVAAIIVEPIQGRGGIRLLTRENAARVRSLADRYGSLIIADEILTGLGRAGTLLKSEDIGLRAELICIGKTLGAGFPVSACLGREDVMNAWAGTGAETVHTSTFFGQPVAASAACASLDILTREDTLAAIRSVGARLRTSVEACRFRVRGDGLLLGVELEAGQALSIMAHLLARGVIGIPAGAAADILQLTPSYEISDAAIDALVEGLHAWSR